jgi:para-nitrobenzyl esterase
VFNTLDTSDRPFTAEDRALAARMSAYWLNFIKSGDPNGLGMPRWPRLTTADKLILEIGARTQARPVLPSKELALFERYTRGGGELGLF